jgi:hypothetical protein
VKNKEGRGLWTKRPSSSSEPNGGGRTGGIRPVGAALTGGPVHGDGRGVEQNGEEDVGIPFHSLPWVEMARGGRIDGGGRTVAMMALVAVLRSSRELQRWLERCDVRRRTAESFYSRGKGDILAEPSTRSSCDCQWRFGPCGRGWPAGIPGGVMASLRPGCWTGLVE